MALLMLPRVCVLSAEAPPQVGRPATACPTAAQPGTALAKPYLEAMTKKARKLYEERQRAEALLKEVLAKVASVTVRVAPEGAEVAVDGVVVGAAPLAAPVFLEPGEHAIAARLDGYERARQVITAKAGTVETVELRLESSAPTVTPGPAATMPPAAAPQGETVGTGVGSAPQGGAADGTRKAVLIAGGVTAGVAAGVGVVLAVLASGKSADADEKAAALERDGGAEACAGGQRAAACGELRGMREDASTFTNVAAWTLIGAGVVGAGTLVYWLAAPRAETRGAVQVAPAVGVRGGGLLVRGTW
jgi:hypothetical protein